MASHIIDSEFYGAGFASPEMVTVWK